MDFSARKAARGGRSPFTLRAVVFVAPFLFFGTSFAQERTAPSLGYFIDCRVFAQGEYHDALKGFQLEGAGLDQVGHLAVDRFDLLRNDDGRVLLSDGHVGQGVGLLHRRLAALRDVSRLDGADEFFAHSPPGQRGRKQVLWGVSKRPSQIGHFPGSVLMSQGKTQAENEQAVRQGGIVQQAILYPINPQEIVRCTALAIRRRRELLGPLSKNDALTADVVSKTTGTIGPPNHWSEAWADLERGLAYLAAGKDSQAMPYLQRSILAAGEFDHPLTCVALLEIGRSEAAAKRL